MVGVRYNAALLVDDHSPHDDVYRVAKPQGRRRDGLNIICGLEGFLSEAQEIAAGGHLALNNN